MESNDNSEVTDREETSDISGLPSGCRRRFWTEEEEKEGGGEEEKEKEEEYQNYD